MGPKTVLQLMIRPHILTSPPKNNSFARSIQRKMVFLLEEAMIQLSHPSFSRMSSSPKAKSQSHTQINESTSNLASAFRYSPGQG